MASNRIGVEAAPGGEPSIRLYGSSFVAAETSALLAEASRDREEIVTATVDLEAVRHHREDLSFFRDRRPELYEPLGSPDGGAAAGGATWRRGAGCAARPRSDA